MIFDIEPIEEHESIDTDEMEHVTLEDNLIITHINHVMTHNITHYSPNETMTLSSNESCLEIPELEHEDAKSTK